MLKRSLKKTGLSDEKVARVPWMPPKANAEDVGGNQEKYVSPYILQPAKILLVDEG